MPASPLQTWRLPTPSFTTRTMFLSQPNKTSTTLSSRTTWSPKCPEMLLLFFQILSLSMSAAFIIRMKVVKLVKLIPASFQASMLLLLETLPTIVVKKIAKIAKNSSSKSANLQSGRTWTIRRLWFKYHRLWVTFAHGILSCYKILIASSRKVKKGGETLIPETTFLMVNHTRTNHWDNLLALFVEI